MTRITYPVWAVLIVTPWLLAYAFLPSGNIELGCAANYEIARKVGTDKEVRSYGTMTSYYHADGSGIGRYAGTLQTGSNRHDIHLFPVYRTTDFTYERIGSFIKLHNRKMAKHIGDNADDAMVIEYVYPGFENNSVDYFQILKMPNGAVAAGIGAMPRVYCQALAK